MVQKFNVSMRLNMLVSQDLQKAIWLIFYNGLLHLRELLMPLFLVVWQRDTGPTQQFLWGSCQRTEHQYSCLDLAVWFWPTNKEIIIVDQKYKITLQNLLTLPVNAPACFIYFISGSLPAPAILHLRQITLFGMIYRLPGDFNCYKASLKTGPPCFHLFKMVNPVPALWHCTQPQCKTWQYPPGQKHSSPCVECV